MRNCCPAVIAPTYRFLGQVSQGFSVTMLGHMTTYRYLRRGALDSRQIVFTDDTRQGSVALSRDTQSERGLPQPLPLKGYRYSCPLLRKLRIE
jgi:hypothetical protein